MLRRTDEHALGIVRSIVATLSRPKPVSVVLGSVSAPRYSPDELYGILPIDLRAPYNVHEVIARIVDGSEFHAFKPLYGTTLVCGFAHIWGVPVGILANNGVLFSESALKGAHFIELACQRGVPLLFLQNISGFMVGGRYEAEGIAKNGAKLVTAVATASVPKITVLIGGSFGAGNYGMAAGLRPALPLPGPTHASPSWAASRPPRSWQPFIATPERWTPEEAEAFKAPIRDRYEREGNPYHASARLWDDGIIDPVQTRDVLGLAFHATLNRTIPSASAIRRLPDVALVHDFLSPHRQSRRNCEPHHPHRATPRRAHGCRSFDRRCAPPLRARSRRRCLHRAGAGARELSRGERILSAARESGAEATTPAMASYPKTPNSPKPS